MKLRLLVFCALIASAAPAAELVPLHFDLPSGLAGYTGRQPVRFGVPIPIGKLATSALCRVVDAERKPVAAQFEIAATWTSRRQHVRWLLIDCFADIRAGQAQPLWLELNAETSSEAKFPLAVTQQQEGMITVDTGLRTHRFARDGGNFGEFVLRDGDGNTYTAAPKDWEIELETQGPVRSVVKMSGRYTSDEGQTAAGFTTRVRLHPRLPFVRVFHTLNWLTDDKTTIGALEFRTKTQGQGLAGLDGKAIAATGEMLRLQQVDWNRVAGSAEGQQLDGWVAAGSGQGQTFVALRWPWQQYPVSVTATNEQLVLGLLGPETAMSLNAEDSAVPAVKHNVDAWNLRIFKDGLPGGDVIYNGPEARPHLTPRGISKTWEFVIWYGDDVAPATRNQLVQHPVFGFAEPAFATQAALPSPASPYDPKRFPEVESALIRAFEWHTRERAEDGDFGVWNYGDLQWMWTHSGAPIYRYWMNLGKGWSILPWSLWLRSGQRRYWENGEANSRHCMDVDSCDIPTWERDQSDWRLRGGQYHYSATHWGYGPEVFTYYVDSEYLPYCYYMTGYERARDLMHTHAEALARFADWDAYRQFFREDIQKRAGRHLYVMVKNLAVMYEATWDERLRAMADECLELTLQAQLESGNFYHVKTNHYLDQPLNIAARVFGWPRVGEALKKWHDFMGDPIRPGPTGCIRGPMSLWSAVSLHKHLGDDHYLDVAARMMRSQAATVIGGDSPWRGLHAVPTHEAGPALRDWPIVMHALRDKPQFTGYLPLASFAGMLPVSAADKDAGWGTRHVMLTLATEDVPIDMALAFTAPPRQDYRIEVYAPDGGRVMALTSALPKLAAAYGGRGIHFQIPADGQSGVYTIVMTVKGNMPSPALARSSTGKVVHYLPPGQRVLAPGMARSGQFWFVPEPDAEVRIGLLRKRSILGRAVAFAPDGKLLAESTIVGSKTHRTKAKSARFAAALPEGRPCIFRAPAVVKGIYSGLAADVGKPQNWVQLDGMRPYLAASKDEWFDPELYPHMRLPDLLGATP